MWFSLSVLVVVVALSLAIIFAALRRAPEAYENEHGLQIVRAAPRRARSARRSRIAETRATWLSRHWKAVKTFLHVEGTTQHS